MLALLQDSTNVDRRGWTPSGTTPCPANAARHLYWQIMLPGALLGTIVGFVTQRYEGGERNVVRP